MGLFNFLWAKTKFNKYKEDIQKEKDCIARIKQKVSQLSNIDKFIDYDDFTVAFAGSKDNMELMLEICTYNDGKKYLHASIDDEVSWSECDYDSIDEFEKEIVDYLSKRINQTVKTIITTERHKSYCQEVYVLDKHTNNWNLIDKDETNDETSCRFISYNTESREIIKTYKLEI
mgnify:CR=1 FL=1